MDQTILTVAASALKCQRSQCPADRYTTHARGLFAGKDSMSPCLQ
jgi:hypothetical protein